MKFANDPLWQKIDTFPLDDPAFTQKLAKENNWDPHFTERVIREYKRFIYLCCIMPNGASPPPVVDEVWHLHILYTVNYWEEFCDRTLGRKLHHHPSKGGPEEKERHVNWLQETIQNYRFIFEEEPPPDIWGTTLKTSPPPPKKNTRLGVIIISGTIITILAVWHSHNFILIPFIALIFIGFMIQASPSAQKKNTSDTGGSSCGSSCSSGDSGCGGGGCGGCGGD